MIEGIMLICYLVVAEPDKPETCREVPAPSTFPTKEICETAAVIAKDNFRAFAERQGHEITKLEATCEETEKKDTAVEGIAA